MNLNVFRGKVYEERVEGLRYTASVLHSLQQRLDNLPVVETAADVLLLVVI